MNRLSKEKQRGAALVEFALLSGLLLFFLFGIFEFGLLWLQSNYTVNAAREGARVAAKVTSAADRSAAAQDAAENYLKNFRLFTKDDGELKVGLLPSPPTVTLGTLPDITPEVQTVVVSITLDTTVVWKPLLWPMLSLLPGVPDYDENVTRFLTQSASYAIE